MLNRLPALFLILHLTVCWRTREVCPRWLNWAERSSSCFTTGFQCSAPLAQALYIITSWRHLVTQRNETNKKKVWKSPGLKVGNWYVLKNKAFMFVLHLQICLWRAQTALHMHTTYTLNSSTHTLPQTNDPRLIPDMYTALILHLWAHHWTHTSALIRHFSTSLFTEALKSLWHF